MDKDYLLDFIDLSYPNTDNDNIMPVALVTGSSRGLGRHVAHKLALNGYSVVVNYVSSEKETSSLMRELKGNHVSCKANVGIALEVEGMAEKIEKNFGRLDAIINNAGITKDNLLLKQTEEEWDRIIHTNLKGSFNIMKIMAPIMIRSGGGHIINVSSYSGLKGKAGQPAYSASKAALFGLTNTAAREFAEYNIKVNALLPGYMQTEMGKMALKAMERAREASVLKKLSTPEDVAQFILYILTTEHITGQVFSLDSRII